MPRVNRSTACASQEAKENVAGNKIQSKKQRTKRGSSKSSSDESSPSKISRSSSSMSPLGEKLESKLKLSSDNKFRSARRALVDNSEFRLPGREKEFDELSGYLNNLIETNGSGSLYISGAPGEMQMINSN